MIITDKHVIVTPPKTGSSYLHTKLCPPNIYVIGPQGFDGEEVDKHTWHIPFRGNDKRIILTTRPPEERFQSLWRHYKAFHGEIDFDSFRELVAGETLSWFYRFTIEDYVKRMPRIDEYLNMKDIDNFLKEHYL